jgi:hypothetical protein
VRNPDHWNRRNVLESLCSTLAFLSDDDYVFEFEKATNPVPFEDYLELSDDGSADCGRSKQNTCSFMRTPRMMPTHSPKSTCAWPGGWARNEDLARSGASDPHVILHHRIAAGVATFDP